MNSFFVYVKEVYKEMRKVSWPTRESVWGSTKVVIVVSLLLTGFIFLSDQFLNKIMSLFI